MSLTAGIVGLPNVGKSTLFNAITKKNILAANYPFATIDPNVGVVIVPDKRLQTLEDMITPDNVVPTSFEFTDIAGLVKGASKGEGLGNKFLSPIRDIDIINLELIFADLEVIDSRIGRIEKKAISTKDKDALFELALLKKIKEALENNIPARRLEYTEDEEKILKAFNLLTKKPIIYMTNVSEEDIVNGNSYVKMVEDYAQKEKSEVVMLCAKVESELSELNEEDKMLFLEDLGIKESGLDKLIKATYSLLGLATYFTAGPKEVKAWTFRKGMKAPECAGIIHSDFERGFIRAEVISFEDYEKFGGEKGAKEAGKMRLEGKDYIMQDGDVCFFRFNV